MPRTKAPVRQPDQSYYDGLAALENGQHDGSKECMTIAAPVVIVIGCIAALTAKLAARRFRGRR